MTDRSLTAFLKSEAFRNAASYNGNSDPTQFAAFIVRACNNHDALLAALQEIARRLEKPGTAGEYKARDIARAAIAKAVQP